ncbi:hypothetical protein GIY23_15350 [Allosaccharopolyspora coralli]|uniref:Uncharacterized protein n=1 Tax=Allosaccharopolyspora coralli TaxID=2665642 RepID=A0A5Q3Q826_9PSEU|nr:hypothetical protein [Allosaccharopolyspora coralli]QGK70708.1 hypothetical protein GIY23_15350 [Allosaccharopolyspora coralli]
MTKNKDDYRATYTDPQLRERLKEQIKASDKGGAPGQWSARKSQLLTQAYEKHGGGYRHGRRKSSQQRSLQEWTHQEWQTESGSAQARHDGRTERYLPKQAWRELTPHQRRETRSKKQHESQRGRQRSANPQAAATARKMADLDELPAREAVKRARTLTLEETEQALRHERQHKARKTVLRQLSQRLDGGE